jgi:divalent metal cation (Fe/Co/Zn/Cd) transporter
MDSESVRVTRWGLYANIGIGLAKIIGGLKFRSQALTADGYHSMGDSLVDLMALGAIFLSANVALLPFTNSSSGLLENSKKIESIGSILIGLMVLTGGVSFAWEASRDLFGNDFLRADSHVHEEAPSNIPSFYAAWLAVLSIVVKEFIYGISKQPKTYSIHHSTA